MNEETIRQRIAAERNLADRDRREFIRWVLLLAANINRPTHSTLRFLVGVVRGEYANATDMEVRRELNYLATRDLVKVEIDMLEQVSAELTRHGIDIAEYTVPVEPGIARPPKV